MVISDCVREIKKILKNSGINDYAFDAQCITEDFIDEDYLFHFDKKVSDEKYEKALAAAKKRATGYPLQYILGHWEFYGLDFEVGEGVLIPRADTEILVDNVLDFFRGRNSSVKIMDLCSGSGCIAIAVKKNLPKANVYALEKYPEAQKFLENNIKKHNSDINIVREDVFDYVPTRRFDCVMSNPPYLTEDEMEKLQTEIEYEPQSALNGGTDGMDYYRAIIPVWRNFIAKGGMIIFEASENLMDEIEKILLKEGFTDIKISCDYSGEARTISGIRL